MSNRAEACRRAKEMSEELGGKPADYMSEAWKSVKEEDAIQERRYSVRQKRGRTGRKSLMKGFANRAWSSFKEGSKGAANDLNFMKAPKDSPDVLFQKTKNIIAKPTGTEIPQKLKDEAKRMFKFW